MPGGSGSRRGEKIERIGWYGRVRVDGTCVLRVAVGRLVGRRVLRDASLEATSG